MAPCGGAADADATSRRPAVAGRLEAETAGCAVFLESAVARNAREGRGQNCGGGGCSHEVAAGCPPPLAPLMLDGKCGNKTVTAIFAFQNGILGWKHPDMKIAPGGKTMTALHGPLRWYKPKPPGEGGITYIPTPKAPDDVTFGDPVMVTAICAKSHEDWGARARYGTVVLAIDGWTLALNIERAIDVLTHGYFSDGTGEYIEGVLLPNLEIRADNQAEWETPLPRLRPHFHDPGDAVFYDCWNGQNSSLLRKLAATPPHKLGSGFGSASR